MDYQGVAAHLDLQCVEPDQRRELFELLQACERATLEVWSERRAKNQTT